jgi:hypothetical protein
VPAKNGEDRLARGPHAAECGHCIQRRDAHGTPSNFFLIQ